MKQPRAISMVIGETSRPEEVLERLEQLFQLEGSATKKGQKIFYDTFDWRLFRKHLIFSVSNGKLQLSRFNEELLETAAGRRRDRYFWWDCNSSTMSSKLGPVIEMRALCPVFTLRYATRNILVLNKDRKTVARVILRKETASSSSADLDLPETLTVQEIRGYEGPFDRIVGLCRTIGLTDLGKKELLLERAFGVSDRELLGYGAKFRVELDDDISIGQAVSKICLNLVETMEINRGGVLEDIDSEFLHDFRIAIRRTRSLLSLLKKALPVEETAFFQSEFKWLGSVTGALRDIDVYLLKKEEYLGMLPPELKPGLSIFFEELEEQRNRELKILRRHLGSKRFGLLLEKWRDYLQDPGSEILSGGVRADKCRPYADKLISKRFRGFLRDGDRIGDHSADSELHDLRIKGKKMRYLLEFFRSFYEDADIERFLKQMKKLQDNLGDFNDLSVQQEMLGSTLSALHARNKRTIRLSAALGGLISMLASKNRMVRRDFKKTYSGFSTDQNRALLAIMQKKNVRLPSNGGAS